VAGHRNDGSPYGVWRIDTRGAPTASDFALVDAGERVRSERFVRECDRNAFLKTRAALRRLLGRVTGAEPQSIQFQSNAWGKPLLAGQRAEAISFSVSHTDGLSVIAVANGRKICIDVERNRSIADRDRVAEAVFGQSTAHALSRLQDSVRDHAFLQLWTAAEAFLKATGTGFAGRPEGLPLSLQGPLGMVQLNTRETSADERSLILLPLALPCGFLGSMVIEEAAGEETVQETVIVTEFLQSIH